MDHADPSVCLFGPREKDDVALKRSRVGAPRGSASAGRGTGGFTLVELMITIFMAALVFSAMVPVFIYATKQSSGDRARNITMNVAQGRIQSIQLLSWSQLTDPNINAELQNNTVPYTSLFGSTYSPPGSSSVYTVSQNVAPSSDGTYVQVTVQVTTPSLPQSPPYTARMATIIINPTANSSTSSPSPSPSPSAPTITSFSPTSGSVEPL